MKKKILTILVMFAMFISPVMADDILTTTNKTTDDETSIASEVISYDAYADNVVKYDKEVDGSAFVAGNLVTFEGDIDGLAFVAGNNADVKGVSEYGFYAGNNLTVSGIVERDAFIAGNIITVNANVGRDAFIAGSSVTLTGNIDRNVFIAAGNVVLDDVTISGDAKIYAESIIIKSNVIIDGELTYSSENKEFDSNAVIGNVIEEEYTAAEITISPMVEFVDRVLSYARLLVVFAVLALFVPKSLKKIGDDDLSFTQIITYIGYALVALILVPMASLMLIMFNIGISLAFILLALFVIGIYISYAYMGYYIGKKIWLKYKKDENTLLEGLIGITILYVISFIPFIGGIVTFLAYLCGIGILLFKIKDYLKK